MSTSIEIKRKDGTGQPIKTTYVEKNGNDEIDNFAEARELLDKFNQVAVRQRLNPTDYNFGKTPGEKLLRLTRGIPDNAQTDERGNPIKDSVTKEYRIKGGLSAADLVNQNRRAPSAPQVAEPAPAPVPPTPVAAAPVPVVAEPTPPPPVVIPNAENQTENISIKQDKEKENVMSKDKVEKNANWLMELYAQFGTIGHAGGGVTLKYQAGKKTAVGLSVGGAGIFSDPTVTNFPGNNPLNIKSTELKDNYRLTAGLQVDHNIVQLRRFSLALWGLGGVSVIGQTLNTKRANNFNPSNLAGNTNNGGIFGNNGDIPPGTSTPTPTAEPDKTEGKTSTGFALQAGLKAKGNIGRVGVGGSIGVDTHLTPGNSKVGVVVRVPEITIALDGTLPGSVTPSPEVVTEIVKDPVAVASGVNLDLYPLIKANQPADSELHSVEFNGKPKKAPYELTAEELKNGGELKICYKLNKENKIVCKVITINVPKTEELKPGGNVTGTGWLLRAPEGAVSAPPTKDGVAALPIRIATLERTDNLPKGAKATVQVKGQQGNVGKALEFNLEGKKGDDVKITIPRETPPGSYTALIAIEIPGKRPTEVTHTFVVAPNKPEGFTAAPANSGGKLSPHNVTVTAAKGEFLPTDKIFVVHKGNEHPAGTVGKAGKDFTVCIGSKAECPTSGVGERIRKDLITIRIKRDNDLLGDVPWNVGAPAPKGTWKPKKRRKAL